MPRRCSICDHGSRQAIEEALVGSEPLRAIASRFDVSRPALQRHKADHLPAAMVKGREAKEAVRSMDLLAELERVHERTERLYRAAEHVLAVALRAQDLDTALAAVREANRVNREARGNRELQAKLVGELKTDVLVNVHVHPEWIQLRTVILRALEPFPDARVAIAGVLTSGGVDVRH